MSFVGEAHNAIDATGTSIPVTRTGAATGNLICGTVSWQSTVVGDLTSVTDGTNAYSIVDTGTLNGICFASFYARNITGGNLTITANFGASRAFTRIQIHEYSGLDTTASVLNAHKLNSSSTFGTGTDAVTSTAATTTVDGCTIFSIAYDDTSTTIPTAGTGFTSRVSFSNAAGDCQIGEDKVQSVQGSIAGTFTTSAGTDFIHVAMLAFLAGATNTLMGQVCL